jgi:hypothetical protein
MADPIIMDNSTRRKRLLLGAMVLLLLIAMGGAYALTVITRMDGNTLYGSHGRLIHTALRNAQGVQYITAGNIDLEGRNRHFQQVYEVLETQAKAPARMLATHVYRELLAGGWPHEMNAYVKTTLRHGNMYMYKAMRGPDGRFVWVAAMRHGRVVNLISYTGIHLDLPLDEQEFDTLTQWVRQNQSN